MDKKEANFTTFKKGRVIRLFIKEGDRVTEGQLIFIVQTSKGQVKILSPLTGIVKQLYVGLGDTYRPNSMFGLIQQQTNDSKESNGAVRNVNMNKSHVSTESKIQQASKTGLPKTATRYIPKSQQSSIANAESEKPEPVVAATHNKPPVANKVKPSTKTQNSGDPKKDDLINLLTESYSDFNEDDIEEFDDSGISFATQDLTEQSKIDAEERAKQFAKSKLDHSGSNGPAIKTGSRFKQKIMERMNALQQENDYVDPNVASKENKKGSGVASLREHLDNSYKNISSGTAESVKESNVQEIQVRPSTATKQQSPVDKQSIKPNTYVPKSAVKKEQTEQKKTPTAYIPKNKINPINLDKSEDNGISVTKDTLITKNKQENPKESSQTEIATQKSPKKYIPKNLKRPDFSNNGSDVEPYSIDKDIQPTKNIEIDELSENVGKIQVIPEPKVVSKKRVESVSSAKKSQKTISKNTEAMPEVNSKQKVDESSSNKEAEEAKVIEPKPSKMTKSRVSKPAVSKKVVSANFITINDTLDVNALNKTKEKLTKFFGDGDKAPGFIDLLVKLVATNLSKFPKFTSPLPKTRLKTSASKNIILLTANTNKKMVAKLLVDVFEKSLGGIVQMTKKAKYTELTSPSLVEAASFTIADYGSLGIISGSYKPIPNQSASISFGMPGQIPVVINNKAVVKNAVTISMVFDQDIFSISEAQEFINSLKESANTWEVFLT